MEDLRPSETGSVSITLLSVTPVRAGKLFAFASVELDIDGIQITIHGIRAMRFPVPVGIRIELPQFRDANGQWQNAIDLPEEIRGPIGDAVLNRLIERGLAKPRFEVQGPARD